MAALMDGSKFQLATRFGGAGSEGGRGELTFYDCFLLYLKDAGFIYGQRQVQHVPAVKCRKCIKCGA